MVAVAEVKAVAMVVAKVVGVVAGESEVVVEAMVEVGAAESHIAWLLHSTQSAAGQPRREQQRASEASCHARKRRHSQKCR